MDLLQLKYFCHAAMTENFSKTAAHFLVPPSNISQTVKRLEKELGVPLFDRRNNNVVLNEKGRVFFKRIKVALDNIEDAKNEVCEVVGEMKGEIRLLVSTNRRIVTRAIEEFKREHPQVSFLINHRSEGTDIEYDVIISDDLALCREYECYPIITEEILLAMAKENPLSKSEFPFAGELENKKFIMMNENSSLFRVSMNLCHTLGFEPDVIIRTDDPYYIRKYVELDLGVALVPSFSWQGLFDDTVVFKRLGDFKRETYAFIKKDRYVSGTVKAFVEVLYRICEENKS